MTLIFTRQQSNKLDENAISDTLRESSKQRLLNAVKQSQQRLGNLEIDFETSAAFLENECYKKFWKSGKSFYLSRNIRWLSTANYTELTTRLSTSIDSASQKLIQRKSPLQHHCLCLIGYQRKLLMKKSTAVLNSKLLQLH